MADIGGEIVIHEDKERALAVKLLQFEEVLLLSCQRRYATSIVSIPI